MLLNFSMLFVTALVDDSPLKLYTYKKACIKACQLWFDVPMYMAYRLLNWGGHGSRSEWTIAPRSFLVVLGFFCFGLLKEVNT